VTQDVVAPAQQDEVGEIGLAAATPVNDVVRVAPLRRSVAAGEPAAAVAEGEGTLLSRTDHGRPSPEVQDL
jgi:hypothetical protein